MWGFILMLALAVLLIVALIFFAIRYRFHYWTLLEVPHEEPKQVLQQLREVRATPAAGVGVKSMHSELERFNELYRRFKGSGPFCGFYRALEPTALILDRELCRQILINNLANFNDRGNYYNRSADPLSAHLYNLRGQSWREARPRLEKTFAADALKSLFQGLERECERLVAHFEAALQAHVAAPVKVRPLVSRYVSDTLAKCVFGLSSSASQQQLDEFYSMTQQALETPLRHGRYVQSLLYKYPLLGKKLGLAVTPPAVQEYFGKLVQEAVVTRRELRKEQEEADYLQLLIEATQVGAAQDDAHVPLQQRLLNQLAAHAYGFLQAGYEATALTVSWALQELALQRELQQRVRDEVAAALQRHDNQLGYECVMELQLMWQVLQETVRLHPVTPYVTRKTLHDYRVSNDDPKYVLKRDMCVIIPVHAIHNDAAFFPEPQLFKPARFSAEALQSRDPCTWLGFGAGARNCVALRFAQLQMRLVLAHLLRSFEFSVDPDGAMPSLEGGIELVVQRLQVEAVEDV